MTTTANYYLDKGPKGYVRLGDSPKNYLHVPSILATDDYVKTQQRERENETRQDRITRVTLHPDFDMVQTIIFHELPYCRDCLPAQLGDFNDEQLRRLSDTFNISGSELREVRDLERRLKEKDPDYRKLGPDFCGW